MPANDDLPPPRLEAVMDLAVRVAAPIEVGMTSQGVRRLIPILGGTVTVRDGAGRADVLGRVLAGGADFQRIVGGEVAHLDARYCIELDDGMRIFVHNRALRVASADDTARLMRGEPVLPSAVYFRCQPTFETQSPTWTWLERLQFVGTGRREPEQVCMRMFAVR